MAKLGFIIFAVLFACVYGATEDIQQNITEVKPSNKLPEGTERSVGYDNDFSLYDVISLVYRKECKRELFTEADEEKTLHNIEKLLAKSKPSGHGSGGGHHTGHYEGHYQEHFSGQYGGPISGVKPIRPIRPIGLGGGHGSGSDEDGSNGGGIYGGGSHGVGSHGGGKPIIIGGGHGSGSDEDGSYGGGSHGGGNYGGGSYGGGKPIIIVGGGSSESDEHGSHGDGHYGGGKPIIIGGGFDDLDIGFGYCKKLALELAESVLHHKSFIKVDCHILKKCLKILKGH